MRRIVNPSSSRSLVGLNFSAAAARRKKLQWQHELNTHIIVKHINWCIFEIVHSNFERKTIIASSGKYSQLWVPLTLDISYLAPIPLYLWPGFVLTTICETSEVFKLHASKNLKWNRLHCVLQVKVMKNLIYHRNNQRYTIPSPPHPQTFLHIVYPSFPRPLSL